MSRFLAIPTLPPLSSVMRGIVLSLTAYTVWSFGDVFVKMVGMRGVQPIPVLLISGFIHCLVILGFALLRKNLAAARTHSLRLESARAALSCIGGVAMVMAFTNLPITLVYVCVFSGPFLVALIARFVLGDPLTMRQLGLIVLGFFGVVVALNPLHMMREISSNLQGYLALPVLLLSFCLNTLLARRLAMTENAISMALTPTLLRTIILIMAFLLLPSWRESWPPLTGHDWMALIIGGTCSATGWMLAMESFRMAPVSVVTPCQYSQLLTGALWGYLFWGDTLNSTLVVGGSIVIFSGILFVRLTRRLAQDVQKPVSSSA